MLQNKKLKIALVTVSLSGGGAERVAATLSEYFEDIGIEVHHIVFAGTITYPYKGKLLHLEQLKDKRNSYLSRFKRFLKLNEYIKQEQFDFIIDFRIKEYFFQEYIIHNWVYRRFVQTVHSNATELYLPKNKFLTNLLYQKAEKIVAVSTLIKQKIESELNINNTIVIHNPINLTSIDELSKDFFNTDYQYILGVGRMGDNVKQFDHLINSYAQSVLPANGVKLLILGEGKLQMQWQELAKSLNLQDYVVFKGSVSNPFVYYKNALFTVMTSKYEGFPMVLLESLACETPVLSYDFFGGLSEIIHHNSNGLLVENQKQNQMTAAINNFFLNKDLYLQCKSNSRKSVEKFSLQTIGSIWLNLFKELK